MNERFTDLEEELKAAFGKPAPTLEVPVELDMSIRGMIKQRSGEIRRRRSERTVSRRVGRWVLPLAAAASIALALGLSRIAIRSGEVSIENQTLAIQGDDINGDGRVDIVDAFVLARAVKSGKTLNGMDQADVDRIARSAVALNGGGTR